MEKSNFSQKQVWSYSLLSDVDIHLFKEGKHFHLYEKLGSHIRTVDGVTGTLFALWAPNAESVHVVGDFNGWNKESHPLYGRWDNSGIFEGFIPYVGRGCKYKYIIRSKVNGQVLEKGDPFAFHWETPPKTASVVWDIDYEWNEGEWVEKRAEKNSLTAPISIYEVHMGSWRRKWDGSFLTYLEMAEQLPRYVKEMGFTHVEFLPLMEHPFYGSWGYQKTGYFATSSRYGTPQDFMHLIESLHQHGIGVILDWVPAHFPDDLHGLSGFDGTFLYEHEDKRKRVHPEWNSIIFNYGRNEVRAFLISSAVFWLDKYQVDGLRVDAVSSMLYLDYSRNNGDWEPNIHGGKENLEAISFLREMNEYLYKSYPYIQMYAEESTAWPMVTRETSVGGLGFGLKWNMGWMHDTLEYMGKDSIYRKYHHSLLLCNLYFFYNENSILPFSHDEVVYGKGSLLQKMPGDNWQKFANLRLMYGYFFTHPGKKILFMGDELAQWNEWNHEDSINWYLLDDGNHFGMQRLVRDLNRVYTSHPALYTCDYKYSGFCWCVMNDSDNSVIAYMRSSSEKGEEILVVCNFTPIVRENYAVGVPVDGTWEEIINTDWGIYGGSDFHKNFTKKAALEQVEGHPFKLTITVPPLSTLIFLHRE